MNPPPGYHRRRIFVDSNSDWLDEKWPIETLAHFLDVLRRCDQCTLILCTKRPENFDSRMLSAMNKLGGKWHGNPTAQWIHQWKCGTSIPPNIILITSVENQATADQRIPELLKIPAACRGLSLEPLLGAVDLGCQCWLSDNTLPNNVCRKCGKPRLLGGGWIEWLICGCESGAKRRECKLEWVRSLVEQGKAAGVATFVKQLQDNEGMVCHDVAEFPADLQIQNWPELKL